jgi:predicted phosphodiesterase
MKIAFISDIHEDYANLMRVVKLIGKYRCEEVICLGDIVGFSAPYYNYHDTRDANACIRWIRENCIHTIAGNHDLYAVRKLPTVPVHRFQFPSNWYSMPFSQRYIAAEGKVWLYEDNELSALLDDEAKEYLNGLPEMLMVPLDNIPSLLTHYIFPDISGSGTEMLRQFSGLEPHLRFMKENGCQLGFSGHIHCEGLIKTYHHRDLYVKGFNRKVKLASPDWVGLPSVSGSKNSSGFLLLDTCEHTVEAVSLRKKIVNI